MLLLILTALLACGLAQPWNNVGFNQDFRLDPRMLMQQFQPPQFEEFRNRIVAPDGSPLITTANGPVRGKYIPIMPGFAVDAFLKVPYADPPMRFERSVPKRPWPGAYDAGEFGPPCASFAGSGPTEDCLYMKILTPAEIQAPLPVLFWPHGGGLRAGSNSDYNISSQAQNIIRRGVVLVQPNYRVGPYGFWSSGGPDANGNYALWDLLLALEYVRREITSFGGDPSRITLVGQGAGGIMVDALSLSPIAQGRFAGVASLSGSVFQPQIDEQPGSIDDKNRALAEAAGCDFPGPQSKWNTVIGKNGISACMKGKSTIELQTAWKDAKSTGNLEWHPTQDNTILPESFAILAARRPNLPFFTGTARDETAWDLYVMPSFRGGKLQDPTNFQDSLNQSRALGDECSRVITKANYNRFDSARQLCQSYFSMRSNRLSFYDKAIESGSTYLYHAPVQRNINYYLRNGNNQVYLYSFDYVREQGRPEVWWTRARAFHNFDMALIENFFPLEKFYEFKFDQNDVFVRETFLNALMNFAKFGNPNTGHPLNIGLPWMAVQPGPLGYPYLSIAAPAVMMEGFHMKDSMFWNEIAVEDP